MKYMHGKEHHIFALTVWKSVENSVNLSTLLWSEIRTLTSEQVPCVEQQWWGTVGLKSAHWFLCSRSRSSSSRSSQSREWRESVPRAGPSYCFIREEGAEGGQSRAQAPAPGKRRGLVLIYISTEMWVDSCPVKFADWDERRGNTLQITVNIDTDRLRTARWM